MNVNFGWRIPSFSIDGSPRDLFISQILKYAGEIGESFHSWWMEDHFYPWRDELGNPETDVLEAWTTICYLAGMFNNPKFGNLVLCNSFRNPALLAKMGATLDSLTGGRFILGIGAGYKEDEHIAYGYEIPDAKTRIEKLEEAVQIIRLLWTKDRVCFNGKHYNIRDAYCNPKPKSSVPIMIGGGGEKLTLKVVAKYADWWDIPVDTVPQLKHKIEVFNQHCYTLGKDPSSFVKAIDPVVAIAENEAEARKIALNPFIKWGIPLVGTPDMIVERLRECIDLGVNLFILRFLDFPSTKGGILFIDEVIDNL
ncbi:MAG: LLM class flavin-dependent oxidoreductase [Candidatus Bathyarchaeia archaeon]